MPSKVQIDIRTEDRLRRRDLNPGTIFCYEQWPTTMLLVPSPVGFNFATDKADVILSGNSAGDWQDYQPTEPVIILDVEARRAKIA